MNDTESNIEISLLRAIRTPTPTCLIQPSHPTGQTYRSIQNQLLERIRTAARSSPSLSVIALKRHARVLSNVPTNDHHP
jgi:hypothetical protein